MDDDHSKARWSDIWLILLCRLILGPQKLLPALAAIAAEMDMPPELVWDFISNPWCWAGPPEPPLDKLKRGGNRGCAQCSARSFGLYGLMPLFSDPFLLGSVRLGQSQLGLSQGFSVLCIGGGMGSRPSPCGLIA
jgi:hypothetical protein